MSSKREEIRKSVLRVYSANTTRSYTSIANEVGTSRWTVKRTIERFLKEQRTTENPRTGRPKGPKDKKLETKVLKCIENNRTMSVRDIAKKTGTTRSMIQRVKQRNNIKTYKKQKVPKRSVRQENTAIKRSRKLYQMLITNADRCLVMDDESYFKYDFSTLPGPQYYNVRDKEDIPDNVKHIGIEKYGPKVLVWQAICQCGLRSRPFFYEGTINTSAYIKNCLKARLLPFLRQHEGDTLFWPDLATSHYAAETLEWYEANNVQFVQKDINPPNVPELRPIERYWALVKRILRTDGHTATSMKEFQKLWTAANKKVTHETVQNLMGTIKKKVRLFSRKKLIEIN